MLKQKFSLDKEIEEIRKQQHRQHQLLSQNSEEQIAPWGFDYGSFARSAEMKLNEVSLPKSKKDLLILLENKNSLKGKLIRLSDLGENKWRIVIKNSFKHFFTYDMNINLDSKKLHWLDILKEFLNTELENLWNDSITEFPQWLEDKSVKKDEANPTFNLDEIREEYKYKKARFGTWRFAMQVGLFTDSKPQSAKFNRIECIKPI